MAEFCEKKQIGEMPIEKSVIRIKTVKLLVMIIFSLQTLFMGKCGFKWFIAIPPPLRLNNFIYLTFYL